MIQVTRKDQRESVDSMVRRFNRKVQQSGRLIDAKQRVYFEREMSKRERRIRALVRRTRRPVR